MFKINQPWSAMSRIFGRICGTRNARWSVSCLVIEFWAKIVFACVCCFDADAHLLTCWVDCWIVVPGSISSYLITFAWARYKFTISTLDWADKQLQVLIVNPSQSKRNEEDANNAICSLLQPLHFWILPPRTPQAQCGQVTLPEPCHLLQQWGQRHSHQVCPQ